MGAAVQRCLCSYRFLSINVASRVPPGGLLLAVQKDLPVTRQKMRQKWESRPEKSLKNTRAYKGLGLRGSSKALDDPAKLPVTDFFHPKSHISIHLMHLLIIVYHCLQIDHFSPQEAHRTAKVGRMPCLRSRFHSELHTIVPSAPSVPYHKAHVEDLLEVAQ